MMPLTFADAGEENIIRRVGGKPEIKKHLENLGFVVGGRVTVISAIGGDLIVSGLCQFSGTQRALCSLSNASRTVLRGQPMFLRIKPRP